MVQNKKTLSIVGILLLLGGLLTGVSAHEGTDNFDHHGMMDGSYHGNAGWVGPFGWLFTFALLTILVIVVILLIKKLGETK